MTSNNISQSKELSSKEVGELLGYTHDYISRLCRTGEMNGVRRGREWFVLEEEVEAFKKRHEVVLLEKKKQLSQKLSKIRKEHEAKKRQFKLSKKQTLTKPETKNIDQAPIQNVSESISKKLEVESDYSVVKFNIPKRIVAACVFALMLGAMSWFGSIENSNSKTEFVHQDSNKSIVETSALTSFSATGIISKGVLDYAQELKRMSLQTVVVWGTMGNAYLSLYMMQGEAVHNAFGDLAYTGGVVLGGYQILGHSFVLGFQNIIDFTSSLLSSTTDFSKKKLNSFTYNVKEGFLYASGTISSILYTHGFVYVIEGFDIVIQNMGSNMYAMNSVFQSGSNFLLSNVTGAIQFDIFKKDLEEVIKIEN